MRLNVSQYANLAEANWKENLKDMSPYTPKYTFYSDFAIAEFCKVRMNEKNAIESTYKDVIKGWGNNIEAMTEIVLVLNHKLWSFFNKVDSTYLGISEKTAMEIAEIYNNLWEKAKDFVFEKFGDDDEAMSYYFQVTD